MPILRRPPHKVFSSLFTYREIGKVYETAIKFTVARGTDRVSPSAFEKRKAEEFRIIHRKCQAGTYRFAPFLELLRSKGPDNPPRIVSIPTVRDRVVLRLMKELLHEVFPESVIRTLPNAYIRDICAFLSASGSQNLWFIRLDIKRFYDSARHDVLLPMIRKSIRSRRILRLVRGALETQTVPRFGHTRDLTKVRRTLGIPQGLSVSNILANIYLRDFDFVADKAAVKYFRFVDDILAFALSSQAKAVKRLLTEKLKSIGLDLNEGKTDMDPVSRGFNYLGYVITPPHVTVKEASKQRFINSIAGMFSAHREGAEERLQRCPWLNRSILNHAFVEDLNERITGSIYGQRRYGWIFYFMEITDRRLLYEIDAVIGSLFLRLPSFNGRAPLSLKSLPTAYYEAKYRPLGGYIHNYNNYSTKEAKIDFLRERGLIDPSRGYGTLSPKEVERLFADGRMKRLSRLEMDVGLIS